MKIFRSYLEQAQQRGIRTACHVATDPVSGVIQFHLFTDDGRGNGNHLFTVKLADLLRIATAYSQQDENYSQQEFFTR